LSSNDIERAILELFETDPTFVAYDREIRYRLEAKYAHDEVGKAVSRLTDKGLLLRTNLPGRKGRGEHPNIFYRRPGTDYCSQLDPMRRKLELSTFISGIAPEMGRHGELAWWRAFRRSTLWSVFPESEEQVGGVRSYGNATTTLQNDLDFIAVRNDITYGVEVKNGLSYPDDLYFKFVVAVELDTIPLVVARWLNPAQVHLIKELGGEYLTYRDALYSTTFAKLITDVRDLLGFPIEARDDIDDNYFNRKTNEIRQRVEANIAVSKILLKGFLQRSQTNRSIRRTLGDKT